MAHLAACFNVYDVQRVVHSNLVDSVTWGNGRFVLLWQRFLGRHWGRERLRYNFTLFHGRPHQVTRNTDIWQWEGG